MAIVNVKDHISRCSRALRFSGCFASAWPQSWAEQGSSFCNALLWVGLSVASNVQGENDDVISIAG